MLKPGSRELSSINIDSASGILAGQPAANQFRQRRR